LAKYLEHQDNQFDAIQFYAKAQYYHQAIKLTKAKNMHNETMALAIQSPNQLKLQTAAYFEQKGFIDKALELYKKGNNLKKAMELAMKANLREDVERISLMMEQQNKYVPSSEKDAETLINEFVLSGQAERALPILIQTKNY